ncbi:MAG TPA: sigma-70 family RNA polymerase sigma factor [Phycisphaerae bacterium]|nr:sigma-70 family RNA polymerase sigma factor [Phycisphaerae bacterium]
MNDAELLQKYAQTHSDDAFRTLIARYINLVYSACRRQLHDQHLAEDATQAVFILLSQRAGTLQTDRIAGWLLTVCRYTCTNIRKTELRRRRREEVVAMLQDRNSQTDNELLSQLDDALMQLHASDREAIALRYLQNRPLSDVSVALGISEQAAQKRLERAILKLRGYFVRHDVPTSSAVLITLLPAHANAAVLAAGLQESLANSIVQICHAGSAGAAPALAIAKGVKTMMFINSLKTSAIVALVFAIVVLGGWWALSRTVLAQSAPQVIAQSAPPAQVLTPAVPATERAFKLDLSTPENTLNTYCLAIRNSDRTAAYACCTINPNRPTTTGDAFLALNMSQNHLIRAAAKAYHSTGEEARQFPTLDVILEQVLTYDRAQNQSAVITGNTATLSLNLPDYITAMFPADIQNQIRSFADHPIRFTKVGNQWKLGPGAAQVNISFRDSNDQPVTDPHIQIEFVEDYASLYDSVASDIEAGKYPTWDDANKAMMQKIRFLHQEYGVSDLSISMSPPQATAKP